MGAAYREFELEGRASLLRLKARLLAEHGFEASPPAKVERAYYDSFDWRIWRAGGTLEAEPRGNRLRLVWRSRDAGEALGVSVVEKMPRFADDLPLGGLRERLAKQLEMRALMVLGRVEGKAHELRKVDGERKTVVRLELLDAALFNERRRVRKPLRKRVSVLPVRGYKEPARDIADVLQSDLGLKPVEHSLAARAAVADGRQPGEYSSKLSVILDPAMPAEAAERRILSALADMMVVNIDGVVCDIDTEFLHDFRVAIRRTRSAITQLKGVMPAAIKKRYRGEFAWLGAVTSPVRDLDVYLLGFEGYRMSLPNSMRAELEPLQRLLIRHRQEEFEKLVAVLNGERLKNLLVDWRRELGRAWPVGPDSPAARQPIARVAARRMRRLFRRALKEGRSITDASPATDLHELRKTCKKLRYMIEFFESLFPRRQTKKAVKWLKVLQDNLGDFQDLEIQSTTLSTYLDELRADAATGAKTQEAIEFLIEELERRQRDARASFGKRFATFASPKHVRVFEGLFAAANRIPDSAE